MHGRTNLVAWPKACLHKHTLTRFASQVPNTETWLLWLHPQSSPSSPYLQSNDSMILTCKHHEVEYCLHCQCISGHSDKPVQDTSQCQSASVLLFHWKTHWIIVKNEMISDARTCRTLAVYRVGSTRFKKRGEGEGAARTFEIPNICSLIIHEVIPCKKFPPPSLIRPWCNWTVTYGVMASQLAPT